jgi:hypothetical protein
VDKLLPRASKSGTECQAHQGATEAVGCRLSAHRHGIAQIITNLYQRIYRLYVRNARYQIITWNTRGLILSRFSLPSA